MTRFPKMAVDGFDAWSSFFLNLGEDGLIAIFKFSRSELGSFGRMHPNTGRVGSTESSLESDFINPAVSLC